MRKFAFTLTAALLLGGAVRTAESRDENGIRVVRTNGVLLLANDPAMVTQECDETPEKVTISDEAPAQEDDETDKREITEKKVIVEVQSSAGSGDENEQKPAQVRGRIIMIGPDGQRRELELDENQLKTFQIELNGDAEAKAEGSAESEVSKDGEKEAAEGKFEERFVIGVQCEEADELLRKHLKLDGKGLLILEVRDKTPAAEAGMEADDLIVAVGDQTLKSREDLVAAVLESDGRELDVRIIRAGDEMTVKVTPKKMKVPVVTETAEMEGFPMPDILKQGKVAFPGVVIDGRPQDPKELGQLLERLQKEAMIEKEILQGLRIHDDVGSDVDELRKEVEALKEEIEALRKARDQQ